MSRSYLKKQFDIIIIGSGGAGLMAAISAIESGAKNIAVISKVIPNNSHTVAAKGGINAALENIKEDSWKWHAHDTLKGSDYLADKDAVDILCSNAASAILDLEKRGVVFSRTEDGKISQRAYGGQTINYGKGGVAYRACYSKDKTGQTILHSLYEQALKNGVKFFSEFFVTDLFIENDEESSEKKCNGCLAFDLASGDLVVFESKIVILATGGYSQIYKNTTSSLICSGDGSALVLQEGLPLQDMEFVQFHPTGIAGKGFLITEATRGEGGYLLNADGERFMKNYAPEMMELSSRDLISQAMSIEIQEGRGCGADKNFLYLDLRHLSEEVLQGRLPGVLDLVEKFINLDPRKDLIPVFPSAHYTMGGVGADNDSFVFEGLAAIGEAACISVHGANRLGCNSLLDLVVFGKISGQKSAEKIVKMEFKNIADERINKKISEFEAVFGEAKKDQKNLAILKKNLQEINEKYLGVFRNENLLKTGFEELIALFKEFRQYKVSSQNLLWNDELVAYFELKNLILNSLAANFAALNRKESRGAHFRSDFNQKNDKEFLVHSLVKIIDFDNVELEFSSKEVRV